MNTPEDPIDALLREQNVYVDDNGFTAQVIQSLPRRRRAWLRPVILLGATVIGSVMAAYWLPWRNLMQLNWPSSSSVFTDGSQILLPLLTVLLVIASLIWSVVSALRWED